MNLSLSTSLLWLIYIDYHHSPPWMNLIVLGNFHLHTLWLVMIWAGFLNSLGIFPYIHKLGISDTKILKFSLPMKFSIYFSKQASVPLWPDSHFITISYNVWSRHMSLLRILRVICFHKYWPLNIEAHSLGHCFLMAWIYDFDLMFIPHWLCGNTFCWLDCWQLI